MENSRRLTLRGTLLNVARARRSDLSDMVLVSNLPTAVNYAENERQLRVHFSQFGKVTGVLHAKLVVNCSRTDVYVPVSDESTAYVTFAEPDTAGQTTACTGAQAALHLVDACSSRMHTYAQRTIYVEPTRGERDPKRLYLRAPLQSTATEVRELFRQFGLIRGALS